MNEQYATDRQLKTNELAEREIRYVVDSFLTIEGPGIPIRRGIPSRTVKLEDVDPLLLLDHSDLEEMPELKAGEGTHPHRGFEIVTYVMKGQLDDQTTTGYQHVSERGLQRITAGSGIVHGGAPVEKGSGPVAALQIWINLAQKDKGLQPEYQVVAAKDIPEINTPASLTRVLVGPNSPTRLHTPALMLDVTVNPNREYQWLVPDGYQGYVYILDGRGEFGIRATPAGKWQFAVLGEQGPLVVHAGAEGVRFFLAAGEPHREQIRWRGPYVD